MKKKTVSVLMTKQTKEIVNKSLGLNPEWVELDNSILEDYIAVILKDGTTKLVYIGDRF